MKIIYFLSFFCLVSVSSAITLPSNVEVNAKYAIDSNSSWRLSDLKSKSFIKFNSNGNLNIGYNKDASIWCWFSVKNKDPHNGKELWLVINNNHIDSLVFYNKNRITLLGDRTKNSSPFLEGQCYKITLAPNENQKIFLKVKKGISFLEFSYSFSDEKKLLTNTVLKTSIIAFFIGGVLLLLIFNFILWYVTKSRLYIIYICYSLLTACYITISTSYLKNYIFKEFLYFSELRIYISCFWFLFLSVFISYFLEIKKYQPICYKIIYYCNLIIIGTILSSLLVFYIHILQVLQFLFIVTYLAFVVILITIEYSAFIHFKINKKNSIYIIIAFLPQFVWGICFFLKTFDLIQTDSSTDWLVYISLFEAVLFGYVLAKNYIETFKKNNELILEIISEKDKSIQLITQVQIRERRTIANVIHDIIGSKIAYVLQLLQLNNISLAKENIMELAIDIREISHKILPKSLDDGALLDSIQSHINIINNSFLILKTELFSYDFPEKIDEIWIYDLYLITVEIINNSIKHGNSTSIIIEFYSYSDDYKFQFIDDGVGFDIKNISQSFGLINIEKRILNYNGTYEINSVKNQGTIIQISIPKK